MNNLNKQYKEFIEELKILLTKYPDNFSATWDSTNSLEKSIKCGDILIIIETGAIIKPINIPMNSKQRNDIRKLIEPIVVKDAKRILDNSIMKVKCR